MTVRKHRAIAVRHMKQSCVGLITMRMPEVRKSYGSVRRQAAIAEYRHVTIAPQPFNHHLFPVLAPVGSMDVQVVRMARSNKKQIRARVKRRFAAAIPTSPATGIAVGPVRSRRRSHQAVRQQAVRQVPNQTKYFLMQSPIPMMRRAAFRSAMKATRLPVIRRTMLQYRSLLASTLVVSKKFPVCRNILIRSTGILFQLSSSSRLSWLSTAVSFI